MTNPATSIEIELDPQNPAQFFACCGVFELAAMYGAGVEAAFVYDPTLPRRACFQLVNAPEPLGGLMRILKSAQVSAPEDSGEAPVTLHFTGGAVLTLDWWLEPDRSGKSRFKLWAGNQKTLLNLVQPMLKKLPNEADDLLLSASKEPMKGRFGLDPRSAWNTLDFGSSLNDQDRDVYTFPAAEMLAAIGLQGFRPKTGANRNTYAYRLWYKPLPLVVARAVVADAIPIAGQAYSFVVEKRGAYSCFAFANPTQGA